MPIFEHEIGVDLESGENTFNTYASTLFVYICTQRMCWMFVRIICRNFDFKHENEWVTWKLLLLYVWPAIYSTVHSWMLIFTYNKNSNSKSVCEFLCSYTKTTFTCLLIEIRDIYGSNGKSYESSNWIVCLPFQLLTNCSSSALQYKTH